MHAGRWMFALTFLMGIAPGAHAEKTVAVPAAPAAAPPSHSARAARRGVAAERPEAPAKPPLPLRVALVDKGPEENWELRVTNGADFPVRIVDDPKLLWLEVTIPGAKAPKVCRLPDDLAPKTVRSGDLRELKPGQSISHPVDPRFYCFSAAKQEVLVPTAQVRPHYGFPSKTKRVWRHGKAVEETLPDEAPFAASPVEDGGSLGPAKNAAGDPVVLDSRYTVWTLGFAPEEDERPDPDEPTLEFVKGSDARTEMSTLTTIRLRNPATKRVSIYFRRDLLKFDVLGPTGSSTCTPEEEQRYPDPSAFRRIAPHGSITVTSRMVELCPRGTFAVPGFYLVQATFQASTDGADVGVDAFTGTLRTVRPAPIRVHRAVQISPARRRTGVPGAPGMPGAPQALPVMPEQLPGGVPPPQMPVVPPPMPVPPPPPPS